MLSFLTAPIDPTRAHEISILLSWHGRLMVLGWGVLAPLAVLAARFYKIWPGQKWPQALDNPSWWRLHWVVQTLVVVLTIAALVLVLSEARRANAPTHRILGYLVVALGLCQFLGGLLRGSKGGPADKVLRGDHFDMTSRRIVFERLHKSLGYGALMLGLAAAGTGLWAANAPVWMPLSLTVFWVAMMVCFIRLQRKGRAVDTYQAIWGPDPALPGNQRDPIGWGITRLAPKGD